MIKIEEIVKEKHTPNSYFVIYNINKNVFTYGGKPEEIFKHLYEENSKHVESLKND